MKKIIDGEMEQVAGRRAGEQEARKMERLEENTSASS
jgi:hypothetical protein